MKTALFTKLFGDSEPARIAETAAALGFDGVDLLVRDGFSASPSDPASIGRNVSAFSVEGMPVLTATTDIVRADDAARAVLARCADAGIPTVRLGYWYYDATRPYREVLSAAQADLDGLEPLAAEFGLTLLVQLHGGTIHSSGALASRLFDGRDAAAFGSYVDPGNQAVQDGREAWRLTFDLLGERLRCVGVKNGGWSPGSVSESGQRRWGSDWLGVADGMVPWEDILTHLRDSGYSGVLSFHGHYELPYPQVIDQTRTDLGFVRRIVGAS